MARRHVLISVSAFSLFALLGPVILHFYWGRLQIVMDNVLILVWPARFLATGGTANNFHDQVMSIGVNIVLFALWGLLTGTVATGTRIVIALYLVLCALIGLVEAWASGFSLVYFSWSALAITFLLYWIPFCAVLWGCKTLRHAHVSR
jgi:hypothetical protein